ncbi:hypothetical protein FSP39_019377 [Pinctada imbricata]|uniref:Uncharacterized protein n=1 Tax=Pinctada imbricata TaxID=66713 RepID=A0AA89BZQ3_PINIB|nr:hypothetical protein FSP39_019377 [Pinctada imbricata]
MMADKGVQNTIEALEERWRMIMFMYDDCVTKLEEKIERDRERRHARQKQELIALSIIYSAFSIPILIMVFIVYLFVLFF